MAPDTIVVGIAAAATRNRDYSPATTTAADLQDYPTGGGAEPFRRFLVSELKPFIDGRYRTEPYRVIVGWSLGGLFVVDVRSQDAYDLGHIPGAKLIPSNDIASRINELPKDRLIVTYCS